MVKHKSNGPVKCPNCGFGLDELEEIWRDDPAEEFEYFCQVCEKGLIVTVKCKPIFIVDMSQ